MNRSHFCETVPKARAHMLVGLLLSASALTGCSGVERPPEIAIDEVGQAAAFQPAALQNDAPVSVQVVETPVPLALPGQLKPLVEEKSPTSPSDPMVSVNQANMAARVQPVPDGFINAVQVYPYSDGALYQVYTAPGQITDVALEAGEQLVGTGPVAAGDTVRWIIGDTESGTGASKKVHILIKPTRTALVTNLVINTDRRTYLLELRSTQKTTMASVSWQYPQDQLIALRRQTAAASATLPIEATVDVAKLRFRYRITGDTPSWRPLSAFDDGAKVYIEMPPGLAQSEAPPLFVIGQEGDGQLVNYRVRQNYYIVDRLFAAAELRLGGDTQQIVRISRTDGKPR